MIDSFTVTNAKPAANQIEGAVVTLPLKRSLVQLHIVPFNAYKIKSLV